MKTILVSGGCGYQGSVLIPKLLKMGYKVISIDVKWFGDFLPKHKNLLNIKCDIKDIEKISLKNVQIIIHLSSISNDPMSELDKNLSWETSALGTMNLVNWAIKSRVKKIIYASSGSVYGIKKEKNVHEKIKLEPISIYNKVKMITERVLLSFKDKIDVIIVRPGTVCGYSPRMRYDLTVNALCYSALTKKEIKVFGGKQIRPNIHIDDLTDLYIYLIKLNNKKELILNAGFENLSIINIAKTISKLIKSKIVVIKDKNDPRSYRMDSGKLKKINFHPKKNVSIAILELKDKFNEKKLINDPRFYSVKWLKKHLKKK
jgi:nucleoside-diphosphate-sugar epimerase